MTQKTASEKQVTYIRNLIEKFDSAMSSDPEHPIKWLLDDFAWRVRSVNFQELTVGNASAVINILRYRAGWQDVLDNMLEHPEYAAYFGERIARYPAALKAVAEKFAEQIEGMNDTEKFPFIVGEIQDELRRTSPLAKMLDEHRGSQG